MLSPPVVYDPYSAACKADPWPVYRQLRDTAPVYSREKWGFYALSRFDDVRAAARDHETYLSFEGIDIDDTATDMSAPGSSWDFVAVGRGHDVMFWADFLTALEKIDPDIAVNIEHEELDQLDGLRLAAQTLLEAAPHLTRDHPRTLRGGQGCPAPRTPPAAG